MTALSASRDTQRYGDEGCTTTLPPMPVAAAVTCYKGGIAVVDTTGGVRPGRASTTDVAMGIFLDTVDNSAGILGAKTARIRRGIFTFDNLATDPVLVASAGAKVYVTDDATVQVSGGGARIAAGTCYGIDAQTSQVIVQIGINS
jgi:hypothetical protein